jgi:GntR family transcriptional regulator
MTKEMLTELLRSRILRSLRFGALVPGDRLPSARTLGEEFGADHRLVLAAYHALAGEGLVELRKRSGIHVARRGAAVTEMARLEWLTDVLLQGLARDIPVADVPDWIRRGIATRRLRVVVIEQTGDQIGGMTRELRDDYGLDASGVDVATLSEPAAAVVAELRGADLLLTTPAHAPLVRTLGGRLGVPVMIADVGPDLVGGAWQMLLREPLYLLVGDERSVATVKENFKGLGPAANNLRIMVVGRDDVASIPEDAAVYVSSGAAAASDGMHVPGRKLPRARVFSARTARALVSFIVHANVASPAPASEAPPRRPRARKAR